MEWVKRGARARSTKQKARLERYEELKNRKAPVEEGNVLLIHVTVKNVAGKNMGAELVIYGALYGSEEMPIVVNFPGFTAKVPAGKTLYYQGYNMSDLLMTVAGTDMKLVHNGVTYLPEEGQIHLTVVAEGRNPAVFAITNTGTENGTYEAKYGVYYKVE